MIYIILILASIVVITIIVYLMYVLYRKYTSDKLDLELNKVKVFEEPKPKQKKKIKKNITMVIKNNNKEFEVEIELFDKALPITCRNFRHIALTGFKNQTYVDSLFYKVVKDKYIIGGDILNNDGTGKISLYGKDFIDEAFKYSHKTPGLLTMENSGEDTNNSQFIITLANIPEFDKKHVAFGRVIRGLYNLYEVKEGAIIKGIN